MAEENQNMQASNAQSNISALRQNTEAFNALKDQIRNRTNQIRAERRAKENEVLFEKSLTSTNENICWQYDRACKAWELARWARDYWLSKWYDWSNIEDVDLLNQYSALFPESANIMYDYITQPHETDPMPYYIKLWWEQPTEEDEAESYLWKWWDDFKWSFSKAWQWLRTLYNLKKDSEEKAMWNGWYNEGALYDYVWDKYWKWTTQLTDDEWKDVERDLRLNPNLLDKYMSQSNAVKDSIMWLTVSALNATPWGLLFNAWVTWLAATEPWEEVFGMLWQWAETLGYYANKFPWLKQYRDALPTEEDKRERDQFVWQEIIALITRWAIKSYKEIKKMANEWWTWWWGWFWWWLWERFQESRRAKNQEKLQDTAWKITKSKTIEETEGASNALKDVDTEWVETYEDLQDRLRKRWEEIELAEDAEYSKDTRKYKPEDTRTTKTYERDGYSTTKELRPVEEWIELLRDFYEWNQEKMANLELLEKKFYNEWLSKWDINGIARAIAQEYDTYKARWQQKTTIAAKNVEDIRRAVKDFAREWNDRLVELDKAWSDNMNTRAMIKDIQDEIVKFKSNLVNKNIFQKFAWKVWDLVSFLWWRDFLLKMFPKMAWDTTFNAITREKQLSSMLKKFRNLNKKINWTKSETAAAKVIDDITREFEEEFWPLEWEIIEKTKSEWYKDNNSYLEDKIEIKEDSNPL